MNKNDKTSEDVTVEICMLHKVNGLDDWCSRSECVFWRLIEAQDTGISNRVGCGLQFHGRIEGLSRKDAGWLMVMKKRLQSTTPTAGKARIIFRRRETKG